MSWRISTGKSLSRNRSVGSASSVRQSGLGVERDGIGLRWDISDSSVLKATYGIREYDLDRAEDLEQDAFSVDFAWKF